MSLYISRRQATVSNKICENQKLDNIISQPDKKQLLFRNKSNLYGTPSSYGPMGPYALGRIYVYESECGDVWQVHVAAAAPANVRQPGLKRHRADRHLGPDHPHQLPDQQPRRIPGIHTQVYSGGRIYEINIINISFVEQRNWTNTFFFFFRFILFIWHMFLLDKFEYFFCLFWKSDPELQCFLIIRILRDKTPPS